MKRSAKLVLRRETLSELRLEELQNVVGAADGTHGVTCSPTGITLCGLCDIDIAVSGGCPPIPTKHRAAC